MRKIIFTLLLAIVGSTWTTSSAICMEQRFIVTDDGMYSIFSGTLVPAPLPCYDDDEPCAPCLTVALKTSDSITYYLTGLDEHWETYIDSLMNSVQDAMMQPFNYHALLSGKTFLHEDYHYIVVNTVAPIQITKIELWSSADWLTGSWEVYKEILANGSGFGDIFMRDVNSTSGWIFDASGAMYQFMKDGTGYFPPHAYTIEQDANGWQLTVEGLFDQPRNLDGGNSPITIYRLTDNELEWQFESYGGDEGPVTYYQFLRRTQSPLRLPSLCDEWNVMVVDNATCGDCEEYHTYRHYLTTDTIIGERRYRKLLVEGEYEGALREEDNMNIYCVPAGTTHEYLLYDFNAKAGDKLENVWLGGSPVDSPNGYVLTVDSVSETTPRIYSLHAEIKFGDEETHTWSFWWVEGVGLPDGPISAKRCLGCADSRGYAVLCAYKDGKQVYASDLSEEFGCYYDSTIDDTPLCLPSLCDEWNILSEWFPDGLVRYDTHTERLTTDTIIGGQRYVKLEGREYRGALREGNNADIYIIPPHSTHEYLLYAFHAQVGDVFDNVWFGGSPSDSPNGCKTTVTAIEEVNGHKEFKLDVEYKLPGIDEYESFPYYAWIDRVGLHAGASGSDCPLECDGDFGTSVLCAYKDGEQIYISHEAELNGCNMQMEPYFPDEMRWTYLAYPLNMDTVFYNEIRVQGEITYDDIVYQNIGGYPVRAIGKRIVARIDEVGEIPLYDFGLNVGESIVTFVPYNNGYYTTVSHKVTAVDSVMLLNGTQARRQTYDDGLIDIEYIGASTGDFFRRMDLFMPVVEGSYRYLCCSVGDELLYEFTSKGCNYDPYGTEYTDTIPLYVKDSPGSSTVDPVDPNEIVATLQLDNLTIREYINEEITYSLSKVPASDQAPARRRVMQSDSFRQSVTIPLTESGTYELELTNPEWNYSIVGTFKYMPAGVEDTPATAAPAQKVLINGRMLIKYGDKVYTLTGMQVE